MTSAQGFNAQEQVWNDQCKDRDAEACQNLRESLRTRMQAGDTIKFSAGELLKDECNAGIRTSCILVDIAKEHASGTIQPEPDSTAEIPVLDTESQTFASDDPWIPRWVYWAVGGFILLRVIVRLSREPNEEEPAPKITPPLPLPPIREGKRNNQGDFLSFEPDKQIIVPWDRRFIHAWLDEHINKTRVLVEDKAFLAQCDDIFVGKNAEGDPELSNYLRNKAEGAMPRSIWKEPEWRFMYLMRAKHDHAGGAYDLANDLWHDDGVEDYKIVLHLFRLDADKDFNPAAVNLHGIMVSRNMTYGEDTIKVPEMEAYLRHLFNLGAPDGYFHITTQLLDFYARFNQRPDEGYVAAGYKRIEKYFPHELRDWRDYYARNPDVWDLNDSTVDPDGVMRSQMEKEMGPMQ